MFGTFLEWIGLETQRSTDRKALAILSEVARFELNVPDVSERVLSQNPHLGRSLIQVLRSEFVRLEDLISRLPKHRSRELKDIDPLWWTMLEANAGDRTISDAEWFYHALSSMVRMCRMDANSYDVAELLSSGKTLVGACEAVPVYCKMWKLNPSRGRLTMRINDANTAS